MTEPDLRIVALPVLDRLLFYITKDAGYCEEVGVVVEGKIDVAILPETFVAVAREFFWRTRYPQ